MEERTIYEVVNLTYNTFGTSDYPSIEGRYYDKGAAYLHCFLLNKGWGNNARVEIIVPDIAVSEETPEDVYERYKYLDAKKLSHKELKEIARGAKTR